jgi:hypothetical protein
MNLGNTEHTLQLFASDPEDAFSFEFAQEQITVGPGQQKEVEIIASPTSSRPFASPRLFGFTISARSIQTPSIVCSSQGQIEQRPVMSPGSLAVAILFFFLLFGWLALRPKPPAMDMLVLDRTSAIAGDTVTVKWKASHANSVRISLPGGDGNDWVLEPEGMKTFDASQSGNVEAVALRDQSQSKPLMVNLEVKDPPVVPDPQIIEFDINPRQVKVGQSFIVHYKFNDAVSKATLVPTNQILDPKIDSVMITAHEPFSLPYRIVAENSKGKSTQTKPIRVQAILASDASIAYFSADPQTVDAAVGKTKISWQTSNAVRAVLYINGQRTDLPATSGETMIDITGNTELILVGFDTKGLEVRKKLTVKFKAPPPPPPVTTGSTAGAPTTTTTSGAPGGATTGITPSTPTTGSPTTTTTTGG